MNFYLYVKNKFINEKINTVFYAIYGLFAVISAIYFISIDQMRNVFMSILLLLSIVIYFIVQYILKIKFGYLFLILTMFVCCGGFLLGPCYDFYIKFSYFDDILHVICGFLFSYLGFMIGKRFIKNSHIFIYILFGFMFSLSVEFVWELIEYAGFMFFKIDMQEDSIVNSIYSFLLAGTHNDTFIISNITETIIKYGNGEELIINGYLDLGLFDTLNDLFICLIGGFTYVFVVVLLRKEVLRDIILGKIIE